MIVKNLYRPPFSFKWPTQPGENTKSTEKGERERGGSLLLIPTNYIINVEVVDSFTFFHSLVLSINLCAIDFFNFFSFPWCRYIFFQFNKSFQYLQQKVVVLF